MDTRPQKRVLAPVLAAALALTSIGLGGIAAASDHGRHGSGGRAASDNARASCPVIT